MIDHMFGATPSPTVANFTLGCTAKDNAHDFSPETIQTVLQNFYVDDLLKSCKDAGSAIKLIKELSQLLLWGGFHLTKWISNDHDVIKSIPNDQRAPAIKDFDGSELPVERALGIKFCVHSDCFIFKVSHLKVGERSELNAKHFL